MAYDAARQQVVLFGGSPAPNVVVGDTWVWDGTNWSPRASGPSPRFNAGMAYDAGTQQVVLFGGQDSSLAPTDHTWVWNGTIWADNFPPRPPPIAGHVMAYDAAHAEVVLFGGSTATVDIGDTWVWVALPQPTGLTVIVGEGSAYLSWDSYPVHVDSFLVDIYQESGTSFVLLGTVTCAPLNLHNTGTAVDQDPSCLLTQLPNGSALIDGTTYKFSVRALNPGVQSAPSVTFTAVPGGLAIGSIPPAPSTTGKALLFLHGWFGDGSKSGTFARTLNFMEGTLGWHFGGQLYHVGGELLTTQTHVDQKGNCDLKLFTLNLTTCMDDGTVDSSKDFFTVNFGSLTADYADGTGLAHQGLEVQSFVRKLRDDRMFRSIQVVAHSNGGIAARSYIEKFSAEADANFSRLVTYGTPHLGADVFNFLGIPIGSSIPILGQILGPSGSQVQFGCLGSTIILGAFLGDLDRSPLIQHNIEYTSIIGQISTNRPLLSLNNFCESAEWDGLVPVTSANLNNIGSFSSGGGLFKPMATLTTNHVHPGQGNDFPAILCALDSSCAMFQKFSPIDMEVTAPDGRIMARDFSAIPGASYMNFPDTAGHETATVLIPFPLGGQYTVRAIPQPGALPTDTFTITFTQNGVTTVIAQDAQIQEIPAGGFHVRVNSRPFANAGSDQMIECLGGNGTPVILNGSASGDQDGDPLTFVWTDAQGNVVGNAAIVNVPAQMGTQTYTLTVTDPLGLSATAQTHVTVRDTMPPILTLTASTIKVILPTATATGALVNLSGIASAADICDPNPTITNNGPASSFFPIGATTVTFTAIDHTGNFARKTLTVQVLYSFGGYLVPVLNDGSAIFNSGRTIPVKFKLTAANGTFITNAVANLQVFEVLNTPTGTVDMTVDTLASGSSNTGILFRFDPTSNQYIYNLSTKGFLRGTYLLRTTLNDGTTHDVQISIK
jgi:hypothetical protein